MTHRLEITLSDERWAQLESARGHEPRASFVKRVLGVALSSPAEKMARIDEVFEKALASPRESSIDPVAPRQSSIGVPGVVRASSLVKQGVRPIPKRGEK